MAIAIPNISTVTNSTASNTCVLNVPAGTADGDLLIAIVSKTNVEAFTEPSGWTPIEENVSAISTSLAAYWRVASSEPSSYSWSWTTAVKNTGIMLRITGHNGFDIGDVLEFGSNTAAPDSPAVSASTAASLVIRGFGAQSNGSLALNTSPSLTSLATQQTTGGGGQWLTTWYGTQTGSGTTGTLTWDLNAATRCEAFTLVVKELAASPQTITAAAPAASTASVTSPALSQHLTAAAPAASTASVGSHTIASDQLIAAGAPAASSASVIAPALSQHLVAAAPAASTAAVGSHTIASDQTIAAGAPAASTADVIAPLLTLQIDAGAPNTATSDVTSPSLSQHIAAGAPASSSASVLVSPVLELEISVGAPAASTASVGAHTVSQGLTLIAGAPAASTADVIAPSLSQHLVAAAPAASTASVGSHVLSQGLTITAGAPAASTSGVIAPALSLNIVAGAPAASTAAVGSHTLTQGLAIVAGAPAASTASVTSPALSQHLTAAAPAASTASVGSHTIASDQLIAAGAPAASSASVIAPALSQHVVAGAPAASTAAVGSHSITLDVLVLVAGPPAASTATVGSHTISRTRVPDSLVVTVAPARELSVVVTPSRTLSVIVKPRSGMSTTFQSGEAATITGTFKENGVATTASGQVNLKVEHPNGAITTVSNISEGATGVYSTDVILPGGGVHRWRMYSSDGYGIAQGQIRVEKNNLQPVKVYPSTIAGSSSVISPVVALA